MQNPNDPEATYRKKAGKDHKWYITNFVEIVDDGKTLLDDHDTKINSYSDSQFTKDILKKHGVRKERESLLTDGAYGVYDNFALAETEQTMRYCPSEN